MVMVVSLRYIPMPMEEGAMQAATKVDLSASDAAAPVASADWKCWFKMTVACAERGSDVVNAITVATKSATAACGWLDDHTLTPAAGLAGSMTSCAMLAQMFSMPAR